MTLGKRILNSWLPVTLMSLVLVCSSCAASANPVGAGQPSGAAGGDALYTLTEYAMAVSGSGASDAVEAATVYVTTWQVALRFLPIPILKTGKTPIHPTDGPAYVLWMTGNFHSALPGSLNGPASPHKWVIVSPGSVGCLVIHQGPAPTRLTSILLGFTTRTYDLSELGKATTLRLDGQMPPNASPAVC
jgi:hypothetical protein